MYPSIFKYTQVYIKAELVYMQSAVVLYLFSSRRQLIANVQLIQGISIATLKMFTSKVLFILK